MKRVKFSNAIGVSNNASIQYQPNVAPIKIINIGNILSRVNAIRKGTLFYIFFSKEIGQHELNFVSLWKMFFNG